MSAAGGFTQPVVDAERIFGAPIERVEWFAHRLEQELQRHAPLKAARVEGCRGCQTMGQAYDSLLAWLVVLLRCSKDADQQAVDTRREFEEALRVAFPKQIREMEGNPMVPRDLGELEPSTLKDILVGIAQSSREENYQSGVRYSEQQIRDLEASLETANRRIERLEETVRRFETARQQVGENRLGVPSAVVDGLFDGKVTLATFLRQMAGPTGSTAYSDGDRTVEVVAYQGRRSPSTQADVAPAVLVPQGEPAKRRTLGDAVDALRQAADGSATHMARDAEVPPPSAAAIDDSPADESSCVPAASDAAGQVTPSGNQGDDAPVRVEQGGGHSATDAGRQPMPERESAGGAPRRRADVEERPEVLAAGTAEPKSQEMLRSERTDSPVMPELAAVDLSDPDAVRRHVALAMAQGSLYTLSRLKASEGRLGAPLGLALSEMSRAHLVKSINTSDGDTLFLPTEAFSRLLGEVGDANGSSSTHPFWSALTNRLSDEHSQTLLAEALCPFLARNYDLVNFRLIRKEGFVAINMSVPHSGHRSFGVICVLLKAPPYPAVEIPPRAKAVWITGEPEQLAQAPAVREGPDVWHGPAMASFDDDVWTPHRVRPGHTLR